MSEINKSVIILNEWVMSSVIVDNQDDKIVWIEFEDKHSDDFKNFVSILNGTSLSLTMDDSEARCHLILNNSYSPFQVSNDAYMFRVEHVERVKKEVKVNLKDTPELLEDGEFYPLTDCHGDKNCMIYKAEDKKFWDINYSWGCPVDKIKWIGPKIQFPSGDL